MENLIILSSLEPPPPLLSSPASIPNNGSGMLGHDISNIQTSSFENDSMDYYRTASACGGGTNPFKFEIENAQNEMQGKGDGTSLGVAITPEETLVMSTEKSLKDSNDVSSFYVNGWYTEQPPDFSNCPFKAFHHSGLPSEFLQYPFQSSKDKRSQQHILAGMNDHSNGIYMKIQFIVNNLKNCLGIWPQLFLQKLNSIIIHADHATVRAVLAKDDFAILKELTVYYVNETKCSMVFRYWCLFYNTFRKHLTPVLPTRLKNQLLAQLQKDFSLACQHLCRCKLDNDYDSSEPVDEEHRKMSGLIQINITAVLMYYLLSKVGEHSDSMHNNDMHEEIPQLNSDKFIKGSVVPLYIKLYESIDKIRPSVTESNLQHEHDAIMMEMLSHLLIVYHGVPFEKNLFPSAIELMLDMGCLSAAVKLKDMLVNLVKMESIVFQKGSSSNKLVFIMPDIKMYFTTMGMSGVIKCLNSLISNVEYQMLLRDEQTFLMDMMVTTQTYLGDCGYWNGDCENIYLHCRSLQCTLEKKLGLRLADVKLDSDTEETANSSGFPLPDYLNADSTASSQTSRSKLHPSEKVTRIEEEVSGDWMIATRQISKMRRVYEHQIDLTAERVPGWMSMWFSRITDFFVNCGKCFDHRE